MLIDNQEVDLVYNILATYYNARAKQFVGKMKPLEMALHMSRVEVFLDKLQEELKNAEVEQEGKDSKTGNLFTEES